MRAHVPGLETAHPLGFALPAVYQDDSLIQRFLSAFDEVIAPVLCTLDNIDTYFDAGLTPPDFLSWLAEWLGVDLDENWSLERRRVLVASIAELYRWRGTIVGLAAEIALHTGSDPEITESGAISWSATPGERIPGDAEQHVTIRVRVPDPASINLGRLHATVAASIPADATYELQVLAE